MSRLNQSIITIVDNKETMYVGVINPSVNDYMNIVFNDNMLELNEVKNSIKYFSQFERCYAKEDLSNIFFQLVASEKIFNIDFSSQDEKNYFIAANVCQYDIKQQHYKQTIVDYLNNSYGYYYPSSGEWLPHIKILEIILDDNLYSYYSFSSFISDKDCVNNLFIDLDLDELIATINLLYRCYRRNDIEVSWFKTLCQATITNSISSQVEDVDVSEYCDNYDIRDLVNQNTKMCYYRDHEDMEMDREAITQTLGKWVVEDIENEIIEKLLKLDETILIHEDKLIKKNLNLDGIDDIIDSYFEPDYDDDEYHGSGRTGQEYISDIEAIFER